MSDIETVGIDTNSKLVHNKSKNKCGSSKKKKKKTAALAVEATKICIVPNIQRRPPPGMEDVIPIYGPTVLSHKDPELTEEQRSIRKFGNGINLSVIGPRKVRNKETLWGPHISAVPAIDDNLQPHDTSCGASNPFSFGFGL